MNKISNLDNQQNSFFAAYVKEHGKPPTEKMLDNFILTAQLSNKYENWEQNQKGDNNHEEPKIYRG